MFVFLNENRDKKLVGDCVVRAISTPNEAEQRFDINNYALKSDLEALQSEINFLKKKVSDLKLDSSESEEMK